MKSICKTFGCWGEQRELVEGEPCSKCGSKKHIVHWTKRPNDWLPACGVEPIYLPSCAVGEERTYYAQIQKGQVTCKKCLMLLATYASGIENETKKKREATCFCVCPCCMAQFILY